MTPAKRLEDRIAALPAFLRAQQPRPKHAHAAAMPAALIDRPGTRAERIEFWVLVICVMMIASAFVTMVRPELGDRSLTGEPVPEDGYPELRLLALPPYLAIGVLCLAHLRSLLRTLAANLVHLVLPAVVALSLAWTIHPELTLRRVVAFLMPTVLGFYIASRYTERGVVRVLFAALLGCLILSVAYIVLVPSVGIMQGEAAGSWRGAFTHKNVFGPVVLHAALFGVAAWLHGIIRARSLVAVAAASCVMVVGSRSVTSLMAFLALAYALPLFAIGKVDGRWLAAYACVTLAIAAAMFPFIRDLGEIMEAFGKDASLTGRLPLWGYVLGFVSDRFMLGYGYGAFWAMAYSPGEVIRGLVGWNPPHAHNTLLQALCDIGLLGASALVLSMTVTVARACRRAAGAASGKDVFPLMAVWILLVLSVSEARLLDPNSLDWIIYISLTAAMFRMQAAQPAPGGAPELAAGRARP